MLMVLYSLFNLFSQRHAKSFESNLENDTDDSILLDLTCYGVTKLLVLLSILCPVINLLLIKLCCLVQKELIRTVDLVNAAGLVVLTYRKTRKKQDIITLNNKITSY